MEILSFFKQLNKKGIKLVLKNGSLSVKSNSAINPELLLEIKKNKESLIEYLQKYQDKNIDKELLSKYKEKNKVKELLQKVVPNKNRPNKVPLSFSQESLWFLDQLQGSLEYHLPFALRLSGDLDKKALSMSLHEIVKRHEVLRTVLYSEEGVGYQKLLSADNWILSEKDLLGADNSLLAENIKGLISIPFNLSSDYMFRSCLYDLGNKEYVLAGVFHHISSDAWSQRILIGEFMELYRSSVSGKTSNLGPLPLQYTDYALWQREYLEGTIIDKQLSYWEEKLTDVKDLQLPTDYVRPAVQSAAGSSISFELNSKLSAEVKKLSQKEGTTVFMTLLTVFKVLLSRYSAQKDICVGTSVANRTQKELEGMIGYFVNTLALRTEVVEHHSFQALLQEVKKTTLDAYDHQQVPLEKVVDRVVETRDKSKNPLFQVLFVLQNTAKSEEIEMEGVTLSTYEGQVKETANFDLKMTVSEMNTGFTVNINYCTDLFKEETIQRLFAHYQELLTGVVKSPTTQLSELSMVTKDESAELLTLFNDTGISHKSEVKETVVDLFEKQVKKTPKATAIRVEGLELSYQELDEQSTQLARHLIKKGVKPDTLVGLCIDRSQNMMVGLLGILKSGGAYVPIDPSYPESRVDYMLKDSGVPVLVSDKENASRFSTKEKLEVVILESDNTALLEESTESIQSIATPANLAYVIYTSGSTGNPKGVLIAHKSLIDYNQGITSKTNILDCTSFGITSSIATDLGNTVIYTSLLQGGSLYIFSEDELTNSEKLSGMSIDCLKMVPSHWKTLQQEGKSFLPNKCLLLGGEQFTHDVIDLLVSQKATCDVYNHYGPTETTIGKLVKKVSLKEKKGHSVPLGIPFGNTEILVLDIDNNLCPIGVTGELSIGGSGLAVGYLNRADLTKEKFVENPFKKGEKIYKTGDLARWLSTGEIEFIGRKDDQIKIRGYRVELGEIDNALTSLPVVTQGCVLAREDDNGDKRLIGYVVQKGELNKEELQESLQASLPEYMVPQLWVQLEELPLTSNGKIDKKALPDPDNSELSTKAYVAPRTEVEEQLATIWQDLLKVEKVGVYDNFFELGGQSLMAIRLISRIKKLGYAINIRDFYSDPTIGSLSTKLASEETSYQVPANGIVKGSEYITPSMVSLVALNQEELDSIMGQVPGGGSNIQDIYPLSPLQEGIYFHHLMSNETKGDPYLFSNLFSFSSTEKRSQFIEGLRFVVSRHDVFRTCIISKGFSQALQIVLREVDLQIEKLVIDKDKDVLPQVEKETASENLYMDLSKAPMLELKVADDEAKESYYLVLNYHHTILDHIGVAKVSEEIKFYLTGQTGLLPKPSLYREFIGNTLNKDKLAESKKYFTNIYGGITESTYPFNLSNTLVDGSTPMLTHRKALSSELRDNIRQVSTDLKMSPAILFHAAFGLVIAKCSNSDKALFGTVLLGRLQGAKGSDSSLGLFMNGLPLLLDLKSDTKTYITRTNTRLQELLNYEQTPLAKIQEWSGITNDAPIFSALLNYRHGINSKSLIEAADSDDKVLSRIQRTNYPLNLDVDDYGDDFKLTTTLSDIGIDPSLVVSYMEEALIGLLKDIQEPKIEQLSSLSILSGKETNKLLNGFNDTQASYPKNKTVVDLFEEQVVKTPNSIAVVYEKHTLSYKELDEKSNQLAHYLVDKGIKSGDLVGICIDRSLEMIIGVLGILKAGGAYVPIDSEYPQARIDYMLQDSAVNIILSESNIKFPQQENLDIVLLDTDWREVRKESNETLKRISSEEDLAYVIYTSGSTGKPKGVMNAHKGIVNQLLWTQETYSLSSEDVVIQKTNFSFDVSVWELLCPLTSGAKLVLAKPGVQGNPAYLKDLIKEEQVTTIHFVPSMLEAFLGELSKGECNSLRRVLCSGEILTVGQVKSFRALFPKLRFDNLYGPTEAAVHVSNWSVPEEVNSLSKIPIGKPVTNTSLYILNTNNELIPSGVIGELHIGGNQVSKGYLNQKALTDKQFIVNPFKEGELIYKTGDLACWLPDGTIEYIGRKDTQVKLRGYRIELGEIEHVLTQIPEIKQAAVRVIKNKIGSSVLAAYVVLEGGLAKELLQSTLGQSLPEYMIPQLWVSLDKMPVTANGKLDRQALLSIDVLEVPNTEYVAPRTELELKLTEIWKDVLGIDKIGVYDNFFELGGHSLLIIKLKTSINKIVNTSIAFDLIFRSPTITELAIKINTESPLSNDKVALLEQMEN